MEEKVGLVENDPQKDDLVEQDNRHLSEGVVLHIRVKRAAV